MVLHEIDPLIITEVYSAGESVIVGADGRALCRTIRARGKANPIFVENIDTLPDVLSKVLQPNDLLLTMGAGSIGQIAAVLPQALSEKCR